MIHSVVMAWLVLNRVGMTIKLTVNQVNETER
jgi:hypothetical protein